MRPRQTLSLLALVAVTAVALSAAPVGAATGGGSARAPYAGPGPYAVGLTTLQLPDRAVSVFYPAKRGSERGKPQASYDQREPYPPDLQALVPAQYDTRITFAAFTGLPGSTTGGPFPVVLFSHGAGSFRLDNASLNAGVASWGFVVVAPEFPERDRAEVTRASLSGGNASSPSSLGLEGQQLRGDADAMLAALRLVETAGRDRHSALDHLVDGKRVAAIGHSAGGGSAFTLLPNPAVKAAIGWAPVPPAQGTTEPAKPTMIIAGLDDIAITPARVDSLYASLPHPKRLVEIGNVGHNGFTDICIAIRQGGGLIEFARQQHLVPDALLQLGENGCQMTNLEPRTGFRVIQHFTVAELRFALGIDRSPVGLGNDIVRAFPGVQITYRHSP
jgi:dienelactone hydrolase